MSAPKSLSQDLNRRPIGEFGGRGPKDINNAQTNIIPRPADEDHDGKPDVNVSEELSEASAHLTLKRG